MRLLEIFDSSEKKRRLSHIKNLMEVGFADGRLDKEELDLIFKIGIRSGLSAEELNRVFTRPESIKFYPPESIQERIVQLHDMVMVMMIDGDIDENELLFCKMTALKLGFKQSIIDVMIHQVIKMVVEGIEADIALHRLMSLMED